MIPVIDLSNLTLNSDEWEDAVRRVTAALESYGCFEAVDERITPQLREELFGLEVIDAAFARPVENKKATTCSEIPFHGYIGGIPWLEYESMRVDGAPEPDDVERFTRVLWPEGNEKFSNTICNFAKIMMDLEQKIRRMVLQGLGLENHCAPQTAETCYALRLSYYGAPKDQDTKVALPTHKDPNILTIVCQQDVGLEVQVRDGEVIHVVPSRNSVTVMIGEVFQAWTNGRFRARPHCVRMEAVQKRYATVFGSHPSGHNMVKVPDELVKDGHPPLFNPYNYHDYLRFRHSEEGLKSKDAFSTFCGVAPDKVVA